jgi:ABC-type transport system involved in multi-copper enzyme maturation permease subunit
MSTTLTTDRHTAATTASSNGRPDGGWFPGSRLIRSEVLKLRRRRGLMAAALLLAPVVVIAVFVIRAVLHLAEPAQYGPAGGMDAFANMSFALSELGAIVAIMIGASAGSSDLTAGVFRSLVVTGRSRWALFTARIPAGLAVLVPIIAVAFALISVASVALAGNNPAPSIGLMFWSGLWVELGTVVLFAIALGVASVIGTRSTTVGILLAVQLVLTPIFMRTSGFNDIRQLLPGIVLRQLQPTGLGQVGPQGGLTMTVPSIAVLIGLWVCVPLVVGAWRTARRDA